MIKVYIASPYSTGNQAENVRRSMDAFERLAAAGLCPFSPLLSHFQHIVHPRPYESWLEMDLEWLRCCDVVVRLPGKSAGADRETQEADKCNIPVVYHNIGGIGVPQGVTNQLISLVKSLGESVQKEKRNDGRI